MTAATMDPAAVSRLVVALTRLVEVVTHLLQVLLTQSAPASHCPRCGPTTAQPLPAATLPPIRAQVAPSPRTAKAKTPGAIRTARWREKQRELALGDTVTPAVTGVTSDASQGVTKRHRDASQGVTSRAVFSSFAAYSNGEEKKNNSLELDKEGGDASPCDACDGGLVTPLVTVTVTPSCDAEPPPGWFPDAVEQAINAAKPGANYRWNRREEAAHKRLRQSDYAGGDDREILRRLTNGAGNKRYPIVSSLQGLLKSDHWDLCAQPEPTAQDTKPRPGLTSVDAAPPADATPCAVDGCDGATEGKRMGLKDRSACLCPYHMARANVSLTYRDDVAAWARAQRGAA